MNSITQAGPEAHVVRVERATPDVRIERTHGTMASDTPKTPGPTSSSKKLLICFFGIFICYFYYGVLQEKILQMQGPTPGHWKSAMPGFLICYSHWGRSPAVIEQRASMEKREEAEKFTYTLALVFVQCCINAAFARAGLALANPGPDSTPQKLYVTMTVSYLGAMLCSFQSLQYVSYPMQVLGKSVKPIPVMILGVIFAHKRYPLQKYMFVLMIVLGVAMFMYKDKKGQSLDSDHTLGWGEIFLLMSLFLDGFTGATQDRMRGEHQTKTHHIMYNVNWWSILMLGTALVLTGEGLSFIQFAGRHPWVLFNMATFGIASALGQNFIFMTVTNFGPLTCSIFTTTRKFFTILGSVIIFGHSMLLRQWLGTILVFIGLTLDSRYGKERKTAVKK